MTKTLYIHPTTKVYPTHTVSGITWSDDGKRGRMHSFQPHKTIEDVRAMYELTTPGTHKFLEGVPQKITVTDNNCGQPENRS